jgi:hypothetical protein
MDCAPLALSHLRSLRNIALSGYANDGAPLALNHSQSPRNMALSGHANGCAPLALEHACPVPQIPSSNKAGSVQIDESILLKKKGIRIFNKVADMLRLELVGVKQ